MAVSVSCSFSVRTTHRDTSHSVASPSSGFPILERTKLFSNTNKPRPLKTHSCSSHGKSREEVVSKKSSKDVLPDGNGKGENTRSQSTDFKSIVGKRKDKQRFFNEANESQVDSGNLQRAASLNAVVKVYCTHTAPDYTLPWQKQRQYTSTGSAFMIGDRKLLTNAHCVEHGTHIKVKRRGDDTKYIAKVLARGVECDIALLSVESEGFWKGAEPLRFGRLPSLQDAVTVVGYPLGGDTISVTRGVVSRIEVTSYGASELLCIQIDAAINPGNSGGPAFNDQGECIGVAFQVYRSEEAENIGYVIPTTVVSHFLIDYERNGKYTGFPCLGVLLQKLENPALRECLKVQSNEGVLVRRVEPTADAYKVLKEGDIIVSFEDVRVGSEGTVPFRSNERITFRYLISQKFAGDVVELGIIREGSFMKVQTAVNPRVHLVPYHNEEEQPSYLIIAGLVFTPLSEPLIEENCTDLTGLKLMTQARYSLPRFKGEQIVILSKVLEHEVNIGFEHIGHQQVLKFNGTVIKNIAHLAHLVDSCKDKYLVFEFEDSVLAVFKRRAAATASAGILKDFEIPSERSSDLLEPYVDLCNNQAIVQNFVGSPVSTQKRATSTGTMSKPENMLYLVMNTITCFNI